MRTGFLFPGQGSQTIGMLKDVPSTYLNRVTQATGYRLVDQAENYQDTVFIQLALLTKAVYIFAELQKEGIRPDLSAGHSIGAFSAAVACGALSFDTAAALVFQRATLMKAAYPQNYGMGVIVGLTRSEAQRLVDATFDPQQPVYLSNENCPLQHTLSGHVGGLLQTLAAAKKQQAQTTKLLEVPVPSHCELMTKVVEQFAPFMDRAPIKTATSLYLKNTDGQATQKADEIRQDLLENIAYPVQWNQMMDLAIEFPPGTTLTKLIHAKFGMDRKIRTINVDQHGIDDAAFLYQKWR